jgi:photosystem II stability/assembly factor-like uncharacterized protein
MLGIWMGICCTVVMSAAAAADSPAAFHDPLDLPADVSARASIGTLTAIADTGAGRVVAVGRYGRIVYSDDAGAAWTQAPVPTSADLVAVTFASPQRGWAVGHGATVLRSDDGGASWEKRLDGRQVTTAMRAHYEPLAAQGDEDAIRALDDTQRLIIEGPSRPFLDVWFDTPDAGFVVGAYNLIFRTVDAGAHWQLWSDHVDNPGGLHLNAIRRIGTTLFIAGEQGRLWRLDEAQQRFVPVPTPYAGTWFGITGTPDRLVLFGLRGNAWTSHDDGASWRAAITGVDTALTAGALLADGRIVLASISGQLLACASPCERFEPLATAPAMAVYGLVALPKTGSGEATIAWVGNRGVTIGPLR